MGRQVLLNDEDISKFVSNIPNVVQSAGGFGQVTINDINDITGINIGGFWDINANNSPFFGAELSGFSIKINIDGVRVFTGHVKEITANNETRAATVSITSDLQKALDHGAIYVSDDFETPVNAIREIADLYKIKIDSGTFNKSNNFYDTDNVLINVNRVRPEGSVFGLIQEIAAMACIRLYSINGVLYCDNSEVQTKPSLATFTDRHIDGTINLYSNPISTRLDKELINGYYIETLQGAATFGETQKQAKTINGGFDSSIQIKSLQAGVFLGELWIDYLNRVQNQIAFKIPKGYGVQLALNDAVIIRNSLAGWDDITADLISIDNTTQVTSDLIGLTR